MPVTRIIPTGDLDLELVDGMLRPKMVTGAEYVRQKISARLKFFLGEWFLDLREGVPYFRDVFVKNPDVDLIRSIFRDVLSSVSDVAAVNQLALTYDDATRELAVEFHVTLVDGSEILVRQPDLPFIIRVQRTAS